MCESNVFIHHCGNCEWEKAYLNSNDVVISREHTVSRKNLLKRWGFHVQPQAAAVDRPSESRTGRRKGKNLIRLGGNGAHIKRQVRHNARVGLIATAGARSNCACAGRVRGATRIVPDDARNVIDIVDGGARRDPASAQPVVTGIGVGLDNDIDTLANGDEHAIGGVGNNGDEVGGDDGEGVAVNGELEVAIDGDVDEANAVRRAGLEDGLELRAQDAGAGGVGGGRAVVGVGAVDQAAIEGWWSTLSGGLVPEFPNVGVVPVAEEEHAEIFIVICSSRTVEDLRAGLAKRFLDENLGDRG